MRIQPLFDRGDVSWTVRCSGNADVGESKSTNRNLDSQPSSAFQIGFPEQANRKRVSVVIPCFNQGQYLADAIESALAQTRRVDEIIVVDDGSTDNTAEVAGRFGPVHYLYQKNGGLSAARNAGLRYTTANYILFLDSDDILLSTAIEHCLEAFSEHPNAAFVYGGFRYVDSGRQIISDVLPQSHKDHFAALLRGNHITMHGTVMYHANLLRSAGGFDETLCACEDYDVYLRLAANYPIVMYPHISAEYRKHGANMSRNAPMMLKTALSVLAKQATTAQNSPVWRAAYIEGKRSFGRHYGAEIVGLLAAECARLRRPRALASLIMTGLRHDRGFLARLAFGFVLRLGAAVRARILPRRDGTARRS